MDGMLATPEESTMAEGRIAVHHHHSQTGEILDECLAVGWGLVRWPLPLGDRVDHVDDDAGTLLRFSPE